MGSPVSGKRARPPRTPHPPAPRSGGRGGGAALLALRLALLALLLSAAGPARAAEPAAPAPAVPTPLPLPADLGPERPVPTPTPLGPQRIDPREGLHFGLGFPYMDIRSDALDVRVKGGKPFSSGVLLHVEGVWGAWRAGYARQLVRFALPPGTALDGTTVSTLAIDANQVWGFHGFRPHHSLYLGYGLGWQHRLLRLRDQGTLVDTRPDSSFLAGLMADWDVALPFALQLRLFEDLGEGLVQARGASLQLAFTVEF